MDRRAFATGTVEGYDEDGYIVARGLLGVCPGMVVKIDDCFHRIMSVDGDVARIV